MRSSHRNLGYTLALAIGITLIAIAGKASPGQSSLQAPPAQPNAFDVASIKPSGENSPPMGIRRTPDQFVTSNTSLLFLIRWAYTLDEDRLIGGPRNMDSVKFDIAAKIPERKLERGQLQLMMQALLVDRFKLAVHKETRTLTSFILIVDKNGPKLHFVDLGEGIGENPFQMPDRGHLVGTKVTATMLARVLSERLHRSVVDESGIANPFNFTLEWDPDTEVTLSDDPGQIAPGGDGRSIFTALKEQLGLRLVSRKVPTEVIVIDHVELSPTAN